MNYIEQELERRKSRVSGFRRFASKVREKAPVVARSILEGSRSAGEGVVKGFVAVGTAYDSVQDYRLKTYQKQAKIAKAKNKRDSLIKKSKSRRYPMGFLPSGDAPVFKR